MSAVRIVALRLGAAAVKSTGAGLIAASRAGVRSSSAGIVVPCRVSQLAFSRSFMSTTDKAAAAADGEDAPKKAAPKKAAAKKPAAKKAKKAVKKVVKKKAVKKPVKKVKKAKKPVKKPVKKVLTEVQKAKKAAVTERKAIAALKETALFNDLPTFAPNNAWGLYILESAGDASLPRSSPTNLGARMTQVASNFKALSAQEQESLATRAAENKVKNEETYKAWVEKYTVEQITAANTARRALIRLAKVNKVKGLTRQKKSRIEDHRVPKKPLHPFAQFTSDLWASGVYASTNIIAANADIAAKWRAMSAEERAKYKTTE